MRRGAAILALFIALVAPSAALAAPPPVPDSEPPHWVIEATPEGREPFDADAELAYQVALDYWGGPDSRCTALYRFLAPAVFSGSHSVAGVGNKPVDTEPCAVIVKKGMPFSELCYVVVHEVGHNHGISHNEDPNSIMFEGESTAKVPGCDAIVEAREKEAATPDRVESSNYRPSNKRVVARKQAWEYWREWIISCHRMKPGAEARKRCFRNVRKYSRHVREVYRD